MARLWSCSAGLQTVTAGIEFSAILANAPAIETSLGVGAQGTGYRIANASGVEGFRQIITASQGVYYFRWYDYIHALPTGATAALAGFRITGAYKVSVRLTTAGLLQLYNLEDSAQIGSDSSAISTGVRYRFELRMDSTTLSATTFELRVYDNADSAADNLIFNPSGTINLAANPTQVCCGHETGGNAGLDHIVSDLAVNDTSTSSQNSWCGKGSQVYQRPNGNGDNSQWTGSDGNSTDNYALVNEVPPSTANYVESNTANQIDDYEMDPTPSALASSAVINVVQVGIYGAVSDATGGDPDAVIRIKATSGGTVEESASLDFNSVTYQGPAPLPADSNFKATLYDLPGASGTLWTKTELDSMQAGIREAVSDTHFARVAALWVISEFVPSSGVSADVTESASAADSPSAAATFVPEQAEAATATESPSAVATFVPAQAEALSADDSSSAQMVTDQSVTEALSATESASALIATPAEITETLSALDIPDAVSTLPVEIAESVTALDAQSAIATMPAEQLEMLSALDVSSVTIITAAEILEAVTALDTSNGALAGGPEEVSEAANANDSVSVTVVTAAGVLETVTAQDLFSAVLQMDAGVLEPANALDVSFTDSPAGSARRNRQLLPIANTLSPLGS